MRLHVPSREDSKLGRLGFTRSESLLSVLAQGGLQFRIWNLQQTEYTIVH